MLTNMTILKCTKYPCFRIFSVDDMKVDIDWICTRTELLLQSEINEHHKKTKKQIHCTKTGQPNTQHKNEKSKQTNI
jgi:hypothetical protein